MKLEDLVDRSETTKKMRQALSNRDKVKDTVRELSKRKNPNSGINDKTVADKDHQDGINTDDEVDASPDSTSV